MKNYLDGATLITLLVTLVLFVVALFVKEWKELLLEAGVFLVSVKLMLMAHKTELLAQKLGERLTRIEDKLDRK